MGNVFYHVKEHPISPLKKSPFDGDVRKELRIQVEAPFHEPESVEHHGLDDLPRGEVVLPRRGDGTVLLEEGDHNMGYNSLLVP